MSTAFTPEQLRQFKLYERVRVSGQFNMFDLRARQAAGLDEHEFQFVMWNYAALRDEVAAIDKARGSAP